MSKWREQMDLDLTMEDYIDESMQKGKLNSCRLYMSCGKDKKKFEAVVKRITDARRLIVLHGNCQTHALKNMLCSNEEFRSKYIICETPRLWVRQDEEQWKLFFDSGILAMIDYLFSQQITKDNGWGRNMSTEYFISQLSTKCSIIMISNLYFTGYFPQLILTHMRDKVGFFRGKITWLDDAASVDKEILRLMLEDLGGGCYRTVEEIVQTISADDYYQQNELRKNIESELNNFEIREENVELKMCDYLRENYDKYLMFVTNVHPTRRVLEELAKRILKRLYIVDLKIAGNKDEIQYPMPSGNRFVIYPSVLKAFHFPEIEYVLTVELQGEELLFLKGIETVLDKFIEDHRNDGRKHKKTLNLNFRQYMLFSARVIQAAIHT